MQIGFINFNTEEKKRVAKMMQLLQESEAIEELGIGRVRDHFSNTLFPGTSTLQHHAKYFAVMPSLYYHTAYKSRKFQTIAEVDRYIKEAEVQITRQLAENSDGTIRMDVTGITGINTYKDALNDYRKFVKYDPAYIYGSGLARYGIIPDTGIERLILELNKKHFADPHNKRTLKSEDETNDAGDLAGDKQVIKTCGEAYQFFDGKTMSLALSEKEASFLRDRINDTCTGTMLSFLIEGKNDIPAKLDYYSIHELLQDVTPDIADIYHKSVLFSKLIHLIDWRFNYSYFDSFGKTEYVESCEKEYNTLLAEHKETISDKDAYQSLFAYIRPIDMMLTEFCEACYQAILDNRPEQVDQLVKAREHTVKRDRSKIGNKAYKDQGRGKPFPNTFRWETVKTMVNEIRNPQ
ncbi:MAG: hypothetical protein KBF13_03680 [Prevotella sp.]|nr:hypothetical protein [Prevotella sp.]